MTSVAAVTTDRIAIRGLSGVGRHGWLDSEREQGQTFVVDLHLDVDTHAAAASDDLADTVDYASIATDVVDVIEGAPVRLIERLAHDVGLVCLSRPAVAAVEVTVHKPQAPIPVPFDDVAVTIRRTRP